MLSHPVYLVDDDDAVRRALALLLSTVGVNTMGYASPQAILDDIHTLRPGCLIIDVRMPVISGLKLQEKLTENGIDWPKIVISGHGDIEACRRAFRGGAVDFLSKPIEAEDLIEVVQRAQELLERNLQQRAENDEIQSLLSALTARERQVLDRIAEGYSTRQIAEGLGLSPRTVESHRAAIGAKLGTTSPAEMTRFWLQGRGVQ